MIPLIDIGVTFLQLFLGKLGTQVPTEVVQAVEAAIDALDAHKNDLITKAALEAQRG